MDLLCPKCGEPWEFDTLHEETQMRMDEAGRDSDISYEQMFSIVAGEFRSAGCVALRLFRQSEEPCTPVETRRTLVAQAAYEVCGDDMDGAASMIADASLF